MNKISSVLIGALFSAGMLTGCDQGAATAMPAGSAKAAMSATVVPAVQALVTREPAQNAQSFGVEVGYANLAGVRQKLGALTKLTDAGTNDYSHGPMLTSDGAGLGIDDAKSVLFVFDAEKRLVAVLVTMAKNPKELQHSLASKYQQVSNKIDSFLNYGTARFAKGDSWVDLEAPHLSFEMTLSYVTKDFWKQFNAQNDQAEQQRQKTRNANL